MSRFDPIRKEYFEALELGDKASDILFYVGATLSILSLLVDQASYSTLSAVILIAFGLSTLLMFVIGLVFRLYLAPRAQDKRLQDFFSSACGVSLTYKKTDGYYNNNLTDPLKRMAAQVLENSHFSKAITLRMARTERIKMVSYVTIWIVCVFCRQTELGVVIAASQAVFSEQLVARWVRLEWLRVRFEKTFSDVYTLFQSQSPIEQFNAMALEAVALYEIAKANAAITLSSRVFEELNPILSNEWDEIKTALGIQ